jgi:hypothetical protein
MEGNNYSGLSLLQDHANDLIERAARADAMGALRQGIRAIMDLVADRPELAPIARSVLAAHDERLIAYITIGAGNQVASIMSRALAEINAQSNPLAGRGLSTPPKLDRAAPGSVRANFKPDGQILFTDDTGAIVERRQQ